METSELPLEDGGGRRNGVGGGGEPEDGGWGADATWPDTTGSGHVAGHVAGRVAATHARAREGAVGEDRRSVDEDHDDHDDDGGWGGGGGWGWGSAVVHRSSSSSSDDDDADGGWGGAGDAPDALAGAGALPGGWDAWGRDPKEAEEEAEEEGRAPPAAWGGWSGRGDAGEDGDGGWGGGGDDRSCRYATLSEKENDRSGQNAAKSPSPSPPPTCAPSSTATPAPPPTVACLTGGGSGGGRRHAWKSQWAMGGGGGVGRRAAAASLAADVARTPRSPPARDGGTSVGAGAAAGGGATDPDASPTWRRVPNATCHSPSPPPVTIEAPPVEGRPAAGGRERRAARRVLSDTESDEDPEDSDDELLNCGLTQLAPKRRKTSVHAGATPRADVAVAATTAARGAEAERSSALFPSPARATPGAFDRTGTLREDLEAPRASSSAPAPWDDDAVADSESEELAIATTTGRRRGGGTSKKQSQSGVKRRLAAVTRSSVEAPTPAAGRVRSPVEDPIDLAGDAIDDDRVPESPEARRTLPEDRDAVWGQTPTRFDPASAALHTYRPPSPEGGHLRRSPSPSPSPLPSLSPEEPSPSPSQDRGSPPRGQEPRGGGSWTPPPLALPPEPFANGEERHAWDCDAHFGGDGDRGGRDDDGGAYDGGGRPGGRVEVEEEDDEPFEGYRFSDDEEDAPRGRRAPRGDLPGDVHAPPVGPSRGGLAGLAGPLSRLPRAPERPPPAWRRRLPHFIPASDLRRGEFRDGERIFIDYHGQFNGGGDRASTGGGRVGARRLDRFGAAPQTQGRWFTEDGRRKFVDHRGEVLVGKTAYRASEKQKSGGSTAIRRRRF